MRELPSGTVTFLFTDLEGSTRLWEASPDVMEQAVRRHDQIMARAIEANEGVLFKHTGDGVCAAFDSPVNGIAAAIQAQQGLSAEAWPTKLDRPLRARMGVHTGTARAQGGDYLGPALNRAARLMAAGHGGQILISAATERLAGDALPDGVKLLDLGAHRLRDLATPEQVFQICHATLARDFPAVRSVDSMPGNLPLQVTSFIGREQQMQDLAAALMNSRLVTLTGVGGVGKTRLALQLASDVLSRYLDGAWFVELAPVGEPDAVPHALARILGAQEVPNRTITETVVEVLRPRTCLLIIDNCEHLLDAAGALAERIVRACPHVTIIATSREPLAVEGEHVWPVRSLAIPSRDEPELEELHEIPSVQLFVDRARAARHDFALTPDNAAPIGEICRRLDGVPLAIELAAARARSMAPSEIAARLDERFRLLRSGRRTAMERHQTLRATVEWSYGLLSGEERHLFDRLSTFAGGFIVEAAEAVCAADPIDAFDIADLASSLAEKSMLVVEDQPDGITRFLMLETLRQFGEERLLERDEGDAIGRAHAAYFSALAYRSFDGIRGPDEARWVQVLEQEFDNVRAAHAWAMTNGDLSMALGIAADLHQFASWRLRGEVYAWVESAMALPGAEDSDRFGDVCAVAAWDVGTRGDTDRAERLAQRAIELVDPNDAARMCEAIYAAGVRGWSEGASDSLDLFARGRDVAIAGGDLVGATFGEGMMALMCAYKGMPEMARRHADEALRTVDTAANPSTTAFIHYVLGEVLQDSEPDRSAASFRHAIAAARPIHARFIAGIALVGLASVRARHGDPREAAGLLLDAVEEWRRRGNWRQQWVTLANVVELFGRLGSDEHAAQLLAATETSPTATTLWGEQSVRLEALRARLASSLGDRYADAVARGSRMSDDETVEFARRALRDARDAAEPLSA